MLRSYAQAVEPMPVALQTNLMPMLFERLRVDKQLIVLDMGPASGATVKFFNQFRCRLSFVDFGGEELLSQQEAEHDEMLSCFRSALNLKPGTKVDLCLFWDLFNYLDQTALRAFLEALEPYVDRNTRGHCLGVLTSRSSLPFYQYGIGSLTSLTQADRHGQQWPVHPHSLRDLSSLLGYFEIRKSRLMQDGRAEYLLSENRDPKPAAGQFL